MNGPPSTGTQSAAHAFPVREWVLANEYPSTSLAGEGDFAFARRLRESTQGRIRVEVKCDAQAGFGTRQQFDAVGAGKIALADSFAGALDGIDPLFQLPSLPFLTATTDDARRLFTLARPQYERVLAARVHKLLYASPWPPTGLWTKAPLAGADALSGRRVRSYDEASAEVFRQLGADAFYAPFTEAVAMLEAGDIDAMMSSGDGGAGAKLWGRLPCFTPLHYAVPLSLTTMHLQTWNELGPAERQPILEAAEQTMADLWQRMSVRVEENYRRLRAAGASVAPDLSPDLRVAFKRAAEGVIAEWQQRAGTGAASLVAAFRADAAARH
jgi:TRAP-type C4-dicarboxylate transport system substrate-binding protein